LPNKQIKMETDSNSIHINKNKPKVGWFCNYTPIEIIYALDLQPYRVLGNNKKNFRADAYLHTPACPYAKNCLDIALNGDLSFLDGVIFNSSCIIMNSLYYLWKNYIKTPFIYLLDVPRQDTDRAILFYSENLKKMTEALSQHFGKPFNHDRLRHSMIKQNQIRELLNRFSEQYSTLTPKLHYSQFQSLINKGFFKSQEEFENDLRKHLAKTESSPSIKSCQKRILFTMAFTATWRGASGKRTNRTS